LEEDRKFMEEQVLSSKKLILRLREQLEGVYQGERAL